jgi:nitrite reductase (NADH) large subunit
MGKSRTSSVNAMSETGTSPKQLVVVGGGMVARRLVDALRERDGEGRWAVTLLAEEPRAPYDRVALTSYFTGRDPDDLALGSQEIWHDRLVSLKRGVKVTAVDREKRTVTTADGSRLPYDALVLATGSYAAVPPVKGNDLRGTFVYRTIDDVADLRSFVESRRDDLDRPVRGAVIGGGLLGGRVS